MQSASRPSGVAPVALALSEGRLSPVEVTTENAKNLGITTQKEGQERAPNKILASSAAPFNGFSEWQLYNSIADSQTGGSGMMSSACAIPSPDFASALYERMQVLASESQQSTFVMPVGIFLILDEANGGDATAQEIIRRFKMLDMESRNIIDFYFIGWHSNWSGSIEFDIYDFQRCRHILRSVGIKQFGGNADLILVDAIYRGVHDVTLNFKEAIHIDLSTARNDKQFPTLGAFLNSVILVTEEIRSHTHELPSSAMIVSMSDRLGLLVAKTSILDFILEKWGNIIGGKSLKHLAVKDLGPKLRLPNLENF